jgi:hypothetical protein
LVVVVAEVEEASWAREIEIRDPDGYVELFSLG